eukprot:CAMPEP_0201706880 /NCGR_PEP_ID=MMETSP0578-20130828/50091_1 /ASSEMBLY_ACC=CAM_ASM_000663 /TAXON_ID=267565 /ORGANISM="Skeletonema grethea, Strain CCMP 1804" /LENGTH=49 /DNA_ID= /DNA_START= /DNA_END= /DNA_ORIENTATION=
MRSKTLQSSKVASEYSESSSSYSSSSSVEQLGASKEYTSILTLSENVTA